jgi:hypothetical protein
MANSENGIPPRRSQRSGLRTSFKDVDFCSDYNQISETESSVSIQQKVFSSRTNKLKKKGEHECVKRRANINFISENGGSLAKKKRKIHGGGLNGGISIVSGGNTFETTSSSSRVNSRGNNLEAGRIMFDSRVLDDCGVEEEVEQANMSNFCRGEAQREGECYSDGMLCYNCVMRVML